MRRNFYLPLTRTIFKTKARNKSLAAVKLAEVFNAFPQISTTDIIRKNPNSLTKDKKEVVRVR